MKRFVGLTDNWYRKHVHYEHKDVEYSSFTVSDGLKNLKEAIKKADPTWCDEDCVMILEHLN